MRTVLSFLALAPAALLAHAEVRHVPSEYATIQAAIVASSAGDVVLVADGTYAGAGNRDLILDRDIEVRSENGPAVTTIDCGGAGRGFRIQPGVSAAAVVDGFSIVGGEESLGEGGGILIVDASPVVRNCRILACRARQGGGVAVSGAAASPSFEDCEVRDNVGEDSVGGILGRGSFTRCIIQGNHGEEFAAGFRTSGPCVLVECLIADNYGATDGGGGLVCGEATLIACTVSGNETGSSGGGILAGGGPVILERTIVQGNCAAVAGTNEIDLVGGSLTMTCCATDPTGVRGSVTYIGEQVFADPQFCDPRPCGVMDFLGDYSIADTSPCTPLRSPCGDFIGAFPIGCGVNPSLETTWGRVKDAYRLGP